MDTTPGPLLKILRADNSAARLLKMKVGHESHTPSHAPILIELRNDLYFSRETSQTACVSEPTEQNFQETACFPSFSNFDGVGFGQELDMHEWTLDPGIDRDAYTLYRKIEASQSQGLRIV